MHDSGPQIPGLEQLAELPEMNPGPVLRMDLEANVLLANAAARTVFGAELVGWCWRDVCPGVDEPFWRGLLETTEVVPLEARIGEGEFVFAHRYDPQSGLVFVSSAPISPRRNRLNARSGSRRRWPLWARWRPA